VKKIIIYFVVILFIYGTLRFIYCEFVAPQRWRQLYLPQVALSENITKRLQEKYTYQPKRIYNALDLSHHNVITNISALKQFDYVYFKATEGGGFQDTTFVSRIKYCIAEGIPCGAYHFFTTSASGTKQFENFKNIVPTNLALIPVLDIEENGRKDKIGNYIMEKWTPHKYNKEIKTWIELCEAHYGVKPIIYTLKNFCDDYKLSQHNCLYWSGDQERFPMNNCLIHQYRVKHADGISGLVDHNKSYNIPFNATSNLISKSLKE
jgi:lysozyme